jgi:hypothetical protein
VEALEIIGNEDAMQILAKCASDPTSYVAAAATAALDALQQKAAQEKEAAERASEDETPTSKEE